MCWKISYKPERTHLLLSSRFSHFFSCSWVPAVENTAASQQTLMVTIWYFGVWSTLSLTRTQPLQTKRCILAAPREAVVWIKWISLLPWLYISKNLAGCTQLSLFHCSLAANNVSWSQEGNVFDYIRSCDYVAWLPFFPSGRHILTNLKPSPAKNAFQSPCGCDSQGTCEKEMMQRGMDRKGQALKKEGQDEWRQKYKVTVRQRGWRDFWTWSSICGCSWQF